MVVHMEMDSTLVESLAFNDLYSLTEFGDDKRLLGWQSNDDG